MGMYIFQDRDAPHTEDKMYNAVSFNCVLASKDRHAGAFGTQSGSDGFSCDTTPLFQVSCD